MEGTLVGQCARHHERQAIKRCVRCGDNLCSDCVSTSRDDVCAPCLERLESRGKVPHVERLLIVMMVHGALILLMAAFLLLYMVVFGASLAGAETPSSEVIPGEMLGMVGGFGLILTALLAVPGTLQVVGGWYMRSFRYRWLSLLALAGGLLMTVISCIGVYCIPTSLGLLIWGAIVLFDADVVKRFQAEGSR